MVATSTGDVTTVGTAQFDPGLVIVTLTVTLPEDSTASVIEIEYPPLGRVPAAATRTMSFVKSTAGNCGAGNWFAVICDHKLCHDC